MPRQASKVFHGLYLSQSRAQSCDVSTTPGLPSRLQVDKIMQAALGMNLCPLGFTTAAQVLQQREGLCLITTGCRELDNILEGRSRDCKPCSDNELTAP